jgi:hypothetical protein
MKKIEFLLVSGFMLLLITNPGYSQRSGEEKDFRFTVKTNPLSALGGPLFITIIPLTAEYKVLFEAKTTEKQSIQFGVGYLGSSPLVSAIGNLEGDTSIVAKGIRGQI